ncbi:uncharacterized protein LOC124281933 [Haliotis rubra]|uniref:uncharacterized protein LOC124281933 n=1 Tax=Haliotis rubra TaxID=36100 RepID=UPI001EE5E0F8|nr:uncharacterized protein LOC124281933 [Haliotis rubra]
MDVPYRCPKCGDGKVFPVLNDLKKHLSQEHSYVPSPRRRIQVFNGNTGDRSGRFSPLLQSFLDEGKRLENDVLKAKDLEMSNKRKRYGQKGQSSFSNSDMMSVSSEFVKPSIIAVQDDHLKNTLNSMTQEVTLSRQKQWKTADALIKAEEVLMGVGQAAEMRCGDQKNVIQKLHAELKEKETDLKKSQEELDRLKKEQNQLIESSEILSRKTNDESQRLSEELEAKESQLSRINTQLSRLRDNGLGDWAGMQTRSPSWKSHKDAKNMMMERNMMRQRAEMNMHGVRDEMDQFDGRNRRTNARSFQARESDAMNQRNSSFEKAEEDIGELDILSQELRKMQRDAVIKMQEKDKELIQARKRSEKLEKDRLVLLHEMDNLLSKANNDNENLKTELRRKNEELHVFNSDLEDAKKEQAKLVGETFELYREADKNIAKLKEMLALKDFQLKAANEKLNQFQVANEQLLAESESIVQHADEKGSIMESMLKTTEKSLQMMEKELDDTKREKDKLLEEAETLKQEVVDRTKSLAELQEEVTMKEDELQKTNNDLQTLQTFLQTTAAKESVARQELEKFITELIERADKAEKELRALKRKVRAASEESQSIGSTHIPAALHNTLTEPVLYTDHPQSTPREGTGPPKAAPRNKTIPRTLPPVDRQAGRSGPTDDSHLYTRSAEGTSHGPSNPSTSREHQDKRSRRLPLLKAHDGELQLQKPSVDKSAVGGQTTVIKPGSVVRDGYEVAPKRHAVSEIGVQTVSEMATQTDKLPGDQDTSKETNPEKGADRLGERPKENVGNGSNKHPTGLDEKLRHGCKISVNENNHLVLQLDEEKELSIQRKAANAEGAQTNVKCSDCSKLNSVSEQERVSPLQGSPVPIHSSTPKKPVRLKKPRAVCRHCLHLTSSTDTDSGDSDIEPKQRHSSSNPHSARAAVLARIMSGQGQREEKLWQGLEIDARQRNTLSTSQQDVMGNRQRDSVTWRPKTFGFDRIRNPRSTLNAVDHIPHSPSVGRETRSSQRMYDSRTERLRTGAVSERNPTTPQADLSGTRRSLENRRMKESRGESMFQVRKENSDSSRDKMLSDRIDRLEDMITEARSKSDEKLEKVLQEVTTDLDKSSSRENIQRLRDSIKPRLKLDKPEVKKIPTGRSEGAGAVEEKDSRQVDSSSYLHPQSPDSFVGLPASKDTVSPLREQVSKSLSTYRSSEPGMVIRNKFYDQNLTDPPKFGSQPISGSASKFDSYPTSVSPSYQYSSNPLAGLHWPQMYSRTNLQPNMVLSGDGERAFPHTLSSMPYSQYAGGYAGVSGLGYSDPTLQYYSQPDRLFQGDALYHHNQYGHVTEDGVLLPHPHMLHRQMQPQAQETSVKGIIQPTRSNKEMSKKMAAFAESSRNTSVDSELSAGLELSIDENGIMWDEDQADTTYASEDLDSFRLSPSGSETAGDVDSSLILSGSGSQPAPAKGGEGHRQILEEIAETDEESSYQGLPAAPSKGQSGVRSGKGHDMGRRTTSSDLRRDKGGMVSDIMSVRDKMMKYLEDDEGTKQKSPASATSRIQEKQLDTKTASNRTCELNNSQGKTSLPVYEKDRALAENGDNIIHNELKSGENIKSRYAFDSSDDLSSSSWSPVKRSTSKFQRADSIDTDGAVVNMAQEPTKQHSYTATARKVPKHRPIVRDENEVVEETILPKSRSRPKMSLDGMSRKLDLLSSSSESLSLSPRRKPCVKKRGIKEMVNQEKQVTPVLQDELNCQQPDKEQVCEEKHHKDRITEGHDLLSLSDSGVSPDTKPYDLLDEGQVHPKSDGMDSPVAMKHGELLSNATDSPATDSPDAMKHVELLSDTTDASEANKPDGVQSDGIDSNDAINHEQLQSGVKDAPEAIKHDEVQIRPQSDAMDSPDVIKHGELLSDASETNKPDGVQLDGIDSNDAINVDKAECKDNLTFSHSFDSDDLAKYDNIPRKQAQPLRATFADDATTDEECSRDDVLDKPGASAAPYREESTDFDFESDLERFSTPFKPTKGHKFSKKNKVLTHKKAQPRGGSASRKSAPKVHADDSSEAASDTSRLSGHRHEAAKRRRVALYCVFRYLDTKTLSHMALVCREWKHVCRHPDLWKRVTLKNERISSSFLVTISQWCSRLQHLTLEGLQCRQRNNDETLEEYHRATRACLETGLEELLKSCQDSLISLNIVACGNHITDKCFWLASCYGRLLEKLHYISSTDPVSPEVLWAIGGGCPGITTLVVPPQFPCLKPKSFSNKCLMLIAKFYPDLQELGIGGQEISIGGLLPLVQGCQRLQYLELDHMMELTSDDVTGLCRAGLRNLSVLELIATPIDPEAVKQIYKSCRHIKRIRVLLSFQDFFEDDSKRKHRDEYQKKIEKLQELRQQPGLGNILNIQAAPVK